MSAAALTKKEDEQGHDKPAAVASSATPKARKDIPNYKSSGKGEIYGRGTAGARDGKGKNSANVGISSPVVSAPAPGVVASGMGMTGESPAATERRSLAAKLARTRLQKAVRYAGAGLAASLPFVAKPSLGQTSLHGFLTLTGVEWQA